MRVDVNAFIGEYPYRKVDGGSPESLLQVMAENGIDLAWVSHLSAVFWRDPTEGNDALYRMAARHAALRPVPAIHPGLANWDDELNRAAERNAPCVRVDAVFYGVDPAAAEVAAVCARAGELGLPVIMAAKLEDVRQRHPRDGSVELTAAAVRGLLRRHARLKLIVTHADRDCIEQVHFGSTEEEAARVWWEICWLWGPPTDDLDHLVQVIGAERFCFGTGMPLRIAESAVAKLELLRVPAADRARIDGGNAERLARA